MGFHLKIGNWAMPALPWWKAASSIGKLHYLHCPYPICFCKSETVFIHTFFIPPSLLLHYRKSKRYWVHKNDRSILAFEESLVLHYYSYIIVMGLHDLYIYCIISKCDKWTHYNTFKSIDYIIIYQAGIRWVQIRLELVLTVQKKDTNFFG